eukprot:PhM_4_TR2957/c0_g1_i1/m.50477
MERVHFHHGRGTYGDPLVVDWLAERCDNVDLRCERKLVASALSFDSFSSRESLCSLRRSSCSISCFSCWVTRWRWRCCSSSSASRACIRRSRSSAALWASRWDSRHRCSCSRAVTSCRSVASRLCCTSSASRWLSRITASSSRTRSVQLITLASAWRTKSSKRGRSRNTFSTAREASRSRERIWSVVAAVSLAFSLARSAWRWASASACWSWRTLSSAAFASCAATFARRSPTSSSRMHSFCAARAMRSRSLIELSSPSRSLRSFCARSRSLVACSCITLTSRMRWDRTWISFSRVAIACCISSMTRALSMWLL